MKQIIIIGAGGHGRVVADLAKLCGYTGVLFLDDNIRPDNSNIVVGKVVDYDKFICNSDFIVAIGNNSVREKLQIELTKRGAKLPILIHPNSTVANGVVIGAGTVIMAGAVINTGATIGDGCIINTCCSVDHDCCVGDYSHVSVGAHIAGTVKIGDRCFVGAGATVINNMDICSDCTIGAGAVVTKSINEQGTYVGVPARRNK